MFKLLVLCLFASTISHLALAKDASHSIANSMFQNAENSWKSRSLLQESSQNCELDTMLLNDPGVSSNANVLWNHTINWERIPFTSPTSDISATNTWFANATAPNTTAYLTTVPVVIPADAESAFFSFWHKFDTERGYDGCMVYYTLDAGGSWFDMGPYFIQGDYNFQMITQSGAMPAFTGDSGSFNKTIADLTVFRGRTIQITFVVLTDFSLPSTGWWVNTIQMYSARCGAVNDETSNEVVPGQGSDEESDDESTREDNYSSDTHGLAVAALVLSIIVGVALVGFIIVVASVYFAERRRVRVNELPMQKIHEAASPAH